MIISFAKTTGALIAGAKTVTRREWSYKHAALVTRQFVEGKTFDAWNYSPRVTSRNPHKVATIRLTQAPYQEWSADCTHIDELRREGFEWMEENGLGDEVRAIILGWLQQPLMLWVVRFEVVEVVAPEGGGK
jgi:hypothetical protein